MSIPNELGHLGETSWPERGLRDIWAQSQALCRYTTLARLDKTLDKTLDKIAIAKTDGAGIRRLPQGTEIRGCFSKRLRK